MKNAPSVCYPVGRSVFQAALLVLLSALLACVVLWFAAASESVMRTVLLVLGWLLVNAWACWSYLRSPCGCLQWQQGQWLLNGEYGGVTLLQDLSAAVLLRWQSGGGSGCQAQWLWLEQNQLPAEWLSLRRALYSPKIFSFQHPI